MMNIITHNPKLIATNQWEIVGFVPNAKNGHRISFRDPQGRLLMLEMENSTAGILRDLLTKHVK